jgi:hypothetical protein
LEPEPLCHFENTAETLRFFDRLLDAAPDHESIKRRIGINYDCCHFAIEYDEAAPSLGAFVGEGLRISKIHLSNALEFDPSDPVALGILRDFDEPTYLHQVVVRHEDGEPRRFADLPEFLTCFEGGGVPGSAVSGRVHFHIPLDADPVDPLRSTGAHVADVLSWHAGHPAACTQFEIETYTRDVLPPGLRRPVEEQIAAEYRWAIQRIAR